MVKPLPAIRDTRHRRVIREAIRLAKLPVIEHNWVAWQVRMEYRQASGRLRFCVAVGQVPGHFGLIDPKVRLNGAGLRRLKAKQEFCKRYGVPYLRVPLMDAQRMSVVLLKWAVENHLWQLSLTPLS